MWVSKAMSPPSLIDAFIAESNTPPPGDGSPGRTTTESVPSARAR
jgi:hypothetical protein